MRKRYPYLVPVSYGCDLSAYQFDDGSAIAYTETFDGEIVSVSCKDLGSGLKKAFDELIESQI